MKLIKLGAVLLFSTLLTFGCSQSPTNTNSTNNTVNSNSSNSGVNTTTVSNSNVNHVIQNVNGTTVSYDIVTENTNSKSNKPNNSK